MMETNLPDSGFLTCFYYTGRHTTDFACDARDENQLRLEKKMRAAAARHAPFTPPAPDAVTLGGPSPLGEPWRFYYSHGNIYLDDSYFYNTLHQVEMHAVTGLRAAAPCTLHATLWSYDAVDLWVNGRRAGGIDLPCYKPIRQTELDLPLQAGDNQIYLRLETLGVRDTRVAFALKLHNPPAGLRIALPDPDRAAPCLRPPHCWTPRCWTATPCACPPRCPPGPASSTTTRGLTCAARRPARSASRRPACGKSPSPARSGPSRWRSRPARRR